MASIIAPCSCEHEFQDKMYGKNMRVHNVSGNNEKIYCTVCCVNPANPKVKNSKPYKNAKSKTNV